jgi:hypothetical protein
MIGLPPVSAAVFEVLSSSDHYLSMKDSSADSNPLVLTASQSKAHPIPGFTRKGLHAMV